MALSKMPDIGPLFIGDASVLDEKCTHLTSGLGWPAYDAGWKAGRVVLAPENGVIGEPSSSLGGDAFYFHGDSGAVYWLGHITTTPRKGTRYAKGAALTRISADHEHPHVHLGIDARKLLGKHLTLGPTIRSQFQAALVPAPCVTNECKWQWIRWYLGHAEYKPYGPKHPAHRPNVPKRIPLSWWPALVYRLGRG